MSSTGANGNNQNGGNTEGDLRGAGGSRRFPAPGEMKGATAFSQDRDVRSSDWLFGAIKRTSFLGENFLAATRVSKGRGPRRKAGDWSLMFLDFVVSDSVDIQPWWDDTNDMLWRSAGFESKPAYHTCYERFVELGQVAQAFENAAAAVIQNARRYEPRIGMYLHVDSTEAETHAALVHDCAADDPNCRVWRERGERSDRRSAREAAWGGATVAAAAAAEAGPLDPEFGGEEEDVEVEQGPGPDDTVDEEERLRREKRPQRMPTMAVRDLRHEKTAEAPTEEAQDAFRDDDDFDPLLDEDTIEATETAGKYRRVKINGCWYRTLDKSAGIRAYTGGRGAVRFWHGFYNSKAICHLMRAPVAVEVASASRQEFDIYPDLIDRAERNLGTRPRAVVADRGFSVTKVFKWNSERGIASVMHWRKSHPAERKSDQERYDRHGIPRCKLCGGPTEFVRFNHTPNPRLWFRCMLVAKEECRGDQSIACAADWRALVPLWRDDPVYLELRRSHKSYEAVHDYWRDRYRVAAADIGQRPKRTGLEWQQLRANAALLIEWIRISHLHGWLGTGRRPCRINSSLSRGNEAAEGLRQFRSQIGLMQPYGKAAAETFGDRRLRRSPSHEWQLRMRWQKRCRANEKARKTAARGARVRAPR
jgi:hypothetical protein